MSRDSFRFADPTRWETRPSPLAPPSVSPGQGFPLQDYKTPAPLDLGGAMPADAEALYAVEQADAQARLAAAARQRRRAAVVSAMDAVAPEVRRRMAERTPSQVARESGEYRNAAAGQTSIGENALGLLELPADLAGRYGLSLEGPLRYGASQAYDTAVDALPFGIGRDVAGLEYSPETLANESVPFSDEISGTADAFINDRPLSDALQEASASRAEMRRLNPGSAMLGTLAQGLVTGPMIGGAAAAGPSTMRNAVLSGARRGLAEGAGLGLAMGLDESESSVLGAASDAISGRRAGADAAMNLGQNAWDLSGDATRSAAMGAGVGGALGGAFGAIGNRARQAATGLRSEAEGTAALDARTNALLDAEPIDDSFLTTGHHDDGLELSDMTVGLREDPDIAHVRALGLTDRKQLRGAQRIFGMQGLADRADMYGLLRRGEIAPTDEVVRRATAMRDEAGTALRDIYSQMGGYGIQMDEAIGEMRALANTYRNTRDPVSQQIAASIESDIQDLMSGSGNVRLPANVDDATISEGWQQHVNRDPAIAAPATLRARNATMRRGPVAEPYEGLVDDDLSEFAAPERPALSGETRTIPMTNIDELQNLIRMRDERNMGYLSGAQTAAPAASRRAGLDMRRILARARDRGLETSLGADTARRARLARDMYATGATVAPQDALAVSQLTTPTLSRRILGSAGAGVGAQIGGAVAGPPGMAAGTVLGGLGGYAAGGAMRRYEWSVLAALNNNQGGLSAAIPDVAAQMLARVRGRPAYAAASRLAGPEALTAVRDVAERIGDDEVTMLADESFNLINQMRRLPTTMRAVQAQLRVSPEAYGEYGPALLDAIRRGTFAQEMARVEEEAPEVAARIEAAPENLSQLADEETYAEEDPGAVEDPDARSDLSRLADEETYGLDEELPPEPEPTDPALPRKTPRR